CFEHGNDFHRRQQELFGLYSANPTRNAAVADKAGGFVMPLTTEVVHRIDKRRRGPIVVLGGYEHKRIGTGDTGRPSLRVRMFVVLQPRVFGLVEYWQIQRGESDGFTIEAAVTLSKGMKPLSDR